MNIHENYRKCKMNVNDRLNVHLGVPFFCLYVLAKPDMCVIVKLTTTIINISFEINTSILEQIRIILFNPIDPNSIYF